MIACARIALAFLAAAATAAAGGSGDPSTLTGGVHMHRLYVDGAHGQIHVRMARPATPSSTRRPTIVLLHENPVSSVEYEGLLGELGRDRTVFAIDTPGYGMSAAPVGTPDIAGYVAEIVPALERLGVGGPALGKAVVFGFHTGSVLAAELALSRPDLVQSVVLAGFPYRTPEERAERLAALPRDGDLATYRKKVIELFDMAVLNGPADIAPDRRIALFAEMMLPGRQHWRGYDAVWRYDYEGRLPRITQPTLFLAPHEMLLEQTRAARRLVPHATLVELPQATEWVLERNAADIAAAIRRFTDVDAR